MILKENPVREATDSSSCLLPYKNRDQSSLGFAALIQKKNFWMNDKRF